jgi:hypothetical protein
VSTVTEVVLTPDDLDEFVRPRVEWVLISGHTNSSRTLHIKSDEHWMEPVCHTRVQHDGGWLDKPISVFPPDYRPFCTQCVEMKYGIEVVDDD